MNKVTPEPSRDVIRYKTILARVIESRPSGTRRRLATALQKNPSFISQITKTSYATPIPPADVPVLFAVCHFSDREREEFLAAYRAAHPVRAQQLDAVPQATERELTLKVPDFGEAAKNDKFDRLVRQIVDGVARYGAPASLPGEEP